MFNCQGLVRVQANTVVRLGLDILTSTMQGILNLCKPRGISSRRVVDRVQRLVRPLKVGHAGTLDPLATGVLVVCVGGATRLIPFIQEQSKCYRATFVLGVSSASEDIETELVPVANAPVPTRGVLESASQKLVGKIEQQPPAYSALKVSGRRAYDLARRGHHVELAPRPIVIHELAIARYEYPEMELTIRCGSGTYVRSLGRDLARAVGTEGVMSSLTRTLIGEFSIADATLSDDLSHDLLEKNLLPPLAAVADWPRRQLSDEEVRLVRHGRSLDAHPGESGRVAGVDIRGELVCLLESRSQGELAPWLVLPPE